MSEQRRVAALKTLALAVPLTLSITGDTGTEYGSWTHYGVTDPVAIGVVSELLFSLSWFLQLSAFVDAVALLQLAAFYDVDVGPRTLPYVLFWAGFLLTIGNTFVVDACYWFNIFVDVDLYGLHVGNVAMYVADEVPTALFLLFVLYLGRKRERDMRPSKRPVVSLVRASGSVRPPRR